jgi:hypothetical protein
MPPDLAAVVDAWRALPEAVKAGIVGMARAIRQPMAPTDQRGADGDPNEAR